MLLRYEIQKIFSKRANQIVLLLLVILVAYSSSVALLQVEWVEPDGSAINGHAAAKKLQTAQQRWSGTLDQTMLENALAEIKDIYQTTEVDTKTQEANYLLRSKLQGVQEIADLLGWSFLDRYDNFAEMVELLQPEDLSGFYQNRLDSREYWLYKDDSSWGYYNYSPMEKQYIMDEFATLKTPMEIGYHEGWVCACEQLPAMMRYGIILLSFLLAGIFSDEFYLKTDSVYYSSHHGRTKATIVKIGVSFGIITLAYWLCVGAYSLIVLKSLGTLGADQSIQSHAAWWNNRQSMTFLQKYLLIIFAGYLGYLFIGFFVMWISIKTKSSVLAVLIPSLLIILPTYLHEFYSPTMRRIIGILPDKLLDIDAAVQYLYLYTIGNQVITSVPIVIMVYFSLTVLLAFLCYWEYRRKQIT